MRERSNRPGRLYAAIPNEMMRDASLSMEARGLLALLMTYSDDWQFSRDHLMAITGWGKDKFGKIMGDLIERGYVEMVFTRDTNGQLLGKTWVIKDDLADVGKSPTSVNTDVRENRRPVKPTSGKTAPIRRTTLKENQKVRIPQTPDGDVGDLFSAEDPVEEVTKQDRKEERTEEQFERFWKAYPASVRKTDKPKARMLFAQIVAGRRSGIPKTDPEEIIDGARRYAGTSPDPQYVPLPATWLNGARWEVEQVAPAVEPPRHYGGHRRSEAWGEIVR